MKFSLSLLAFAAMASKQSALAEESSVRGLAEEAKPVVAASVMAEEAKPVDDTIDFQLAPDVCSDGPNDCICPEGFFHVDGKTCVDEKWVEAQMKMLEGNGHESGNHRTLYHIDCWPRGTYILAPYINEYCCNSWEWRGWTAYCK